jgi:hypothetical protein
LPLADQHSEGAKTNSLVDQGLLAPRILGASRHVCGLRSAVNLDHREGPIHRRHRKRRWRDSSSGGDAAGLGEDASAVTDRFCRRVCRSRAMHAVSLGHLDIRPFWLGLEPGGSCNLPLCLFFRLYNYMARSNKVIPKRKRGRPATGKDPLTALRLSPDLTKAIEKWAAEQPDEPNRSEAIRRLAELGLTVKTKAASNERLRAARSDRAKELAANTIEKIIDPAALPEDRIERKRRLTKGPAEFRDARVDQTKPKEK